MAIGSVAGVAGCVGDPGTERDGPPAGFEPSESPTPTGSPTETPYWAGECEEVEKEWTDPKRDSVEPKSLPEGSPELTEDRLLRAAGGDEKKPDPREVGTTVECWSSPE